MAKKKNHKNKTAKKPEPAATEPLNTEVLAALSSINQPVLLKLCRLCESKDGPFLNIFDADKITAKKIDDVMPFTIAENDDLPHKICFRCSAKVEELHEFIQKCIKTQENMRQELGKKGPLAVKTKHRALWEEKLNKSNISNDDICDALIKKAMEGIKDIPLQSFPKEDDTPLSKVKVEKSKETATKKATKTESKVEEPEVPQKEVAENDEKLDNKPPTRSSRSKNAEPLLSGLVETYKNRKASSKKLAEPEDKAQVPTENTPVTSEKELTVNKSVPEVTPPPPIKQEPKPAFNIMDHVSMIKVNGVGILFQCKLCNRNFLKKEVVMSHACAKNSTPKVEIPKDYGPPEPPKIPLVKYINTKTENSVKTSLISNEEPIEIDDDSAPSPVTVCKPKPKIGPASKVKNNPEPEITEPPQTPLNTNTISNSTPVGAPIVHFPSLPSLNSRYKLVPGPNNTFTLVEEQYQAPVPPEPVIQDNSNAANFIQKSTIEKASKLISSKVSESRDLDRKSKKNIPPKPVPQSSRQPYPVGLFKTVTSNSTIPPPPEPAAFTTPAMKKQSYTIVQTGNPSKLLISTKPQVPVDEVPKKKSRKTSKQVAQVPPEQSAEQPFSVTLEDTTPPKDPGFFTFINVDPLLQPSYVLPTDNIIQESQITTSSSVVNATKIKQVAESKDKDKDKDKYSCNMCGDKFTREKKLLTHIQSHYNQMDAEDEKRLQKVPVRKRGRNS